MLTTNHLSFQTNERAHTDQAPSMVEKFTEMTVQPGDFVSMRCTSLGSPLAQIHWSIDGQAVPNSARYRFGDFVVSPSSGGGGGASKSAATSSSQTSRLVSHFNISTVRVEDGGLYRCTAKNIAGTVSHQARLNVYGKASVKMHTPNMTALSNSDIELNCPFYGFPFKSITWFSRGKTFNLIFSSMLIYIKLTLFLSKQMVHLVSCPSTVASTYHPMERCTFPR